MTPLLAVGVLLVYALTVRVLLVGATALGRRNALKLGVEEWWLAVTVLVALTIPFLMWRL